MAKLTSRPLAHRGKLAGGLGLLAVGTLVWAASPPAGITSITLVQPTGSPCSSGSCTYDASNYSTAQFEGCSATTIAKSSDKVQTLGGGDLDADGYQDLVIGLPTSDSGKGRVYVVYGSAAEPAGKVSLCSGSSNIISVTGKAAGDALGSAVAVGDITGDGKADLALGAPGVSSSRGAVYVLPGSTSRFSSSSDITTAAGLVTVSGESGRTSQFGTAVAIGDFYQDTKADLLVGAPVDARVFVVPAPVTTGAVVTGGTTSAPTGSYCISFTGEAGSDAGAAVGNAGDVNADSSQDMVIGAPKANSGDGRVHVVNGRPNFTLGVDYKLNATSTTSFLTLNSNVGTSSTTYGGMGFAVTGTDVDNNGYSDVIFGAPTAFCGTSSKLEAGRVYIYFGSSSALSSAIKNITDVTASIYCGETAGDHLGQALSPVGDADGDNYKDVVVGGGDVDSLSNAPYDSYGAAYLIYGRITTSWPASSSVTNVATTPYTRFIGKNKYDYAGRTVWGNGSDIDGDDYPDFFIGAPGYVVSSSNNEGRVFYVSFGDFYDSDGDNQSEANGDCNDNDPDVYYDSNGYHEVCDGVDNDCDGLVDDADSSISDPKTYYRDADSDGYGSTTSYVLKCSLPSGYVVNNTDCNDNNAAINPGATETCDSVDNDCDAKIDDADSPVTGQKTYYRDLDGDTYGNSASGVKNTCASTAPSGYSSNTSDCDDSNSTINPGATETCDSKDNDCDGKTDDADSPVSGQNTYYSDSDKDGYGNAASSTKTCASSAPTGTTSNSSDCNDNNAAINPAAVEKCDLVDNDCDGKVDYEDSSLDGDTTLYKDADGDGYGDSKASPEEGCSAYPRSGYVTNNSDCNDSSAAVNPAATETCDGLDNDCDTKIDDADSPVSGQKVYYRDEDGDGYGSATNTKAFCASTAPSGYTADSSDCDDLKVAINPGAEEICDGIDNDCDAKVDDQDNPVTGGTIYYRDADSDGHGSSTDVKYTCSSSPPSGYLSSSDDCNDSNKSVYPGAPEGTATDSRYNSCIIPDGLDNDCDGVIDEGTCSSDDDKDGSSEYSGDCDDSKATINPSAAELCDSIDQNCNGNPTDGYDSDGDGALSSARCTGDIKGSDCNDADPTIYGASLDGSVEAAPELCDGLDNDCDLAKDEDFDQDGDGYLSEITCSNILLATDCDDTVFSINPGGVEVCDGIDQDCDDEVDNGFDADGDGHLSIALCPGYAPADDCDDADPDRNPDEVEVCDGKDNDCDNSIEDEKVDSDRDGYAVCNATNPALDDCDDSRKDVYPGATELCDGIDNNCDADLDEAELDQDDDGYRGCENDCDDGDRTINPAQEEICDGTDNNCNGLTDSDAVDKNIYYHDEDGDGQGDAPVESCSQPAGTSLLDGDCNDENDQMYEGAAEKCDGLDNNCDSQVDSVTYDQDGDGYLDASACTTEVAGGPTDCNDANVDINPGAAELANDNIDNNCDGNLDAGGIVVGSAVGCSSTGGEAASGTASQLWWLGLVTLGLARRRKKAA